VSLSLSEAGLPRPGFNYLLAGSLIFLLPIACVAFRQSPAKPRRQPPPRKSAPAPEWPQFGGPTRDFMVDAEGLAAAWPEGGPKRLWSRELGAGHSSIAVDRGTLYTMYSSERGAREVVVAIDAATGRTLWEHEYEADLTGVDLQWGMGPHATPLVAGDLLYATGVGGMLLALEKRTGRVVWSHDLRKEFGLKPHLTGYSCNPLAYKNTVIVTVGGKGRALMAFERRSGAVVWSRQDFAASQSSPIIINIDGQEQLVTFLAEHVVGMNPDDGELLWSHPHKARYDLNISLPVWGKDNLLFLSSFEGDGSRVLRLSRSGGRTSVRELWFSPRMRVYFGSIIRVGDMVLGSSGYEGVTPLTAVNVKTGELFWQERGYPRSNFIYAGDKLLLLDEDGNLSLATVSPRGIKVISKAGVLTNYARTAPTLVGTKLYLRDQKAIMALDLS
jgi:outer membrane protein assembly factor BamB